MTDQDEATRSADTLPIIVGTPPPDAPTVSTTTSHAHANASPSAASAKTYCLCKHPLHLQPTDDSTFMIQCDVCTTWFHGPCVDLTNETDGTRYETWHCPNCALYHGPSQLKKGLRKRRRTAGQFVTLHDASPDNVGAGVEDMVEVDYVSRLRTRHKSGKFVDAATKTKKKGSKKFLIVMKDGTALTSRYADEHGFDRPVLVTKNTPQLGLTVPDASSFVIADIARLTGQYRVLRVMDVSTQLTLEYTMKEWVEYMTTPPNRRTQVLNLISFEFSQTPMNDLVRAPQFVRDVDLVRLNWPKNDDDPGDDPSCMDDDGRSRSHRPRVAKYCLMGAEGSYTDFHVDFGGTSVWYHVHRGMKVFYFIEPTKANLRVYSTWAQSGTRQQSQQFLGDLVPSDTCCRVTVSHGQTLFIPSGWIHAVYTPRDSTVFGGNFVHGHSLGMQLGIYRLEKRMKVGREYMFPNYEMTLWYTAWAFVNDDDEHGEHGSGGGKGTEMDHARHVVQTSHPLHVLRGYEALANQLLRWAESSARQHRVQFPSDMDVLDVAKRLGVVVKRRLAQVETEQVAVTKKRKMPKVMKGKVHAVKKAAASRSDEGRMKEEKGEKKGGRKKGGRKKLCKQVKNEVGGKPASSDKGETVPLPAAQNVAPKDNREGTGRDVDNETIQDVFWAQCDECNEWHEVPEALGVAEDMSFSCKDVDKQCKEEATLWAQCKDCREWHTVCHCGLACKTNFTCLDLDKQCVLKPGGTRR